MKTKLFTLFFAIMANLGSVYAERVQINNLYYEIDPTSNTAKVTYEIYNSNQNYYGLAMVSIPTTVNYQGINYDVTEIGPNAFYLCKSLSSINFPNGLKSIASSAFYGCSKLTAITIPESVTTVADYAFLACSSLNTITINSDHIVNRAYLGSSVGLTSKFGNYVTTYHLGDSITGIGTHAFQGSILTSITIGNGVKKINSEAFKNCSNLNSVIFGDSLQYIEANAFMNCSGLTSIIIPNSVVRIENGVFSTCTNLDTVIVGENVSYFGSQAFPLDRVLASVTLLNPTPASWSGQAWPPFKWGQTIYIPCGSMSSYASTWKYFTPSGTFTFNFQYGNNCPPDVNYYIVTFEDWDGTILKTEQVEEGQSATAPANPTREGYTFTGWDVPFNNVQSNLTVTAQYTQNTPTITYYTVTFKDWNGTILKTEQVEKGHSATAPANPTREGYTFTGWDVDFSNVQSDLTVTAQYRINDSTTVSGVSLNKKTLQLLIGSHETLIASIVPSTASNKNVTWTSSNTNVATVSNTGEVIANAEGICTITCEAVSGHYKAECYVVVSSLDSGCDYSFEPTTISNIKYEATDFRLDEVSGNDCVTISLGNDNYILYLLYIGSLKNGAIPIGTYEVSSSLQAGTICYSIGGDDTADYDSFMITDFDSEGNYSAAYYIIAGNLIVGKNNSFYAKLISANGSDIEVTYNWITSIEETHSTQNASKIMHDGQVLIQRGNKTYTITGVEVK